MTTLDSVRRSITVGGLALAVLASGCASLTPSPVPTTWTAVTHLMSLDQSTGKFKREGVALFKNGETALQTVEGQFTARDGSSMVARNSYRFEDGSTFVHEGTAQARMVNGLLQATGQGRFTSGTGRFAGISGTTSSTSRSLSASEQVSQYRAEGTLASR